MSLKVQKHPSFPYCLHCWTVNHILFNLPFTSNVLKEALLTSMNSSWALAFLIFSACLGCVSVSLLASPSSLSLLCTFLLVFEIGQEFLGHLCWPSVTPAIISVCQKGLIFYFEKAVFEDKGAHLGSFGWPGQNFPFEVLLRHSLNKTKYVDLKVQDSILYTFLRILNATVLCLLQPIHSHSPPILPAELTP